MVSDEDLINPDEIKEFYKSLKTVIDDVDCKNPLKVYSFANSLISMGNYFMNNAYSHLVYKGFCEAEIHEFKQDNKLGVKNESD